MKLLLILDSVGEIAHFIALMSCFRLSSNGHKTGAFSDFQSVNEKAIVDRIVLWLEGLDEPQGHGPAQARDRVGKGTQMDMLSFNTY